MWEKYPNSNNESCRFDSTSGTAINTFNYNFDAANQLTSASATGTSLGFTYDNLGRLLISSNSGTTNIPTVVLTNSYDANSQRTQQTAIVSGTADYKDTWIYDNANRLTQVKQEGQTGGNTVAAKRVDFTYDTGGLTTAINGTTIRRERKMSRTRRTRTTCWPG